MVPTLKLICEHKIRDLMPKKHSTSRWEASGVLVKDQHYFVVFDDRSEVACLSDDLESHNGNRLCGVADKDCGYEGITFNPSNKRFYLLVESRKEKKGCYKAFIVEYDEKFEYVKHRPIEFTFKSSNKGFEAVVHLRRNNTDFLLALCEGNKCQCGEKGRQPGNGRLQLFKRKRDCWQHVRAIALPASLPFVDYSGMSIENGRIAIVSQVNSMLWVGQIDEADWTCRDRGQLYEFPRSDDGSILYGNIEGVAWIAPTRIVTVSDRRSRKNQPDKKLSEKDQSLHVFEIIG